MARCRIVDLRHKQVVNVKDGTCLGCVDDMEIDMATAKLVSIIIYGRLKWFGLLGRCDDICIKWEDIQVIGEDTIRKSFPASMNFFLQFPAACDIINVAKSHASSGPLVPFAEAWAEIQGGAEV